MSRLRYFNPFRIRSLIRDIRSISAGGGPRVIRLTRVGEVRGILPAADIELEVEAMDGTVTSFASAVPVPFPAGWGYRLARRLGVPVISAIDHERIHAEVPVPRLGR